MKAFARAVLYLALAFCVLITIVTIATGGMPALLLLGGMR